MQFRIKSYFKLSSTLGVTDPKGYKRKKQCKSVSVYSLIYTAMVLAISPYSYSPYRSIALKCINQDYAYPFYLKVYLQSYCAHLDIQWNKTQYISKLFTS